MRSHAGGAAVVLIEGETWLQLQYWAYRAASYAQLNLLVDPAWLALVFC